MTKPDRPTPRSSQPATAMLETKTQPFWGGEAVFDRVADRLAGFDVLATPQSLAFAKRATELEPDDPRWWRFRVALTTTPIGYPEDHVDRQADLERLVVDAAKHDPDNGVYGLLSAAAMVDTAIGFDDKQSVLVIQDRHSLDAAVLQAIEAIQKPDIVIGEPAIDGVQRLHELVGQTGRGTIQSLQSHSTGQRALGPIVTLIRTMFWAGEVCERQNEPEQAAEFYDVGLQIADAVLVKGDPQLRNQGVLYFVRSDAYRRKLTLEQKTPAELTLDSPAGRALIAEQAFKTAVARSQRMRPTVHWFYIVAGRVGADPGLGVCRRSRRASGLAVVFCSTIARHCTAKPDH